MTVTSCLLNFRNALIAVIPSVERAGIAWKRPDAYDEWDSIATTLFEKLVVEVLRWSLPGEEQEGFRMPPYDLLLPKYADYWTLEVDHPSLPEGRWLFHAFGTMSEPLDLVEILELSEDGSPRSRELATCPVEGAIFHLG